MSGSLHPYKYWKEEEAYYFNTPSGTKYVASFLQYPNLSDNLYVFNFDVVTTGTLSVYNEHVRDTICVILRNFFSLHAHSLLITCDTTDGRGKCRKRLFNQWYRMFAPSGLSKIDRDGKAESYDLFVSLFIWDDNPDKEQLLSFIDDFCSDLIL